MGCLVALGSWLLYLIAYAEHCCFTGVFDFWGWVVSVLALCLGDFLCLVVTGWFDFLCVRGVLLVNGGYFFIGLCWDLYLFVLLLCVEVTMLRAVVQVLSFVVLRTFLCVDSLVLLFFGWYCLILVLASQYFRIS